MSITRVQGNTAQNGGNTTQAVTLGAGVTLGNLLVVAFACGSNNITITPPNASWTQAALNQPSGSSATIETSLWYLVVDAGHAGQTSWTWTISTTHSMFLTMEEWSASTGWPANPVDASAVGDTAGSPTQSTTIQSGTTGTTTQAEELWVASLAYKNGAQTESGITAGWTKDLEATNSAHTMTMLYQVTSATGAAACQYTIGTAKYWAGCVVAFKDNAAVSLPVLGDMPSALNFSTQVAAPSPVSYAQKVLALSPLRYYRTDENSGTVAHDLGASGQNGTISGGVSATGGLVGADRDGGMLFDGSSGYISLPATGLPSGASAVSLECWFKIASIPSTFPMLLSLGNRTAGQQFDIYIDASGNLWCEILSVATAGGGSISLNTPHHAVATYDGTTLKLYLDGVLLSTTATGTASVTYGAAAIGAQASPLGGYFPGIIDEAAIYGYALSASQVSAHYNAGTTPAVQTVTLSETAGNATNWTASITYGTLQPSGWLVVSPTSGSLAGNGSASPLFNCIPGSLGPGTYTATVTFTATTGGSTATVVVTFGITAVGTMVYVGTYRIQNAGTTLTMKRMVGKRGELATTVYDPNALTRLYATRAFGGTLTQNALLVHLQQYQQIRVFADGQATPTFSGYLTSPQETKPGFQPLLLTQLTAIDQHYLADKRIVATVYRNQTCGFIVQDIVTNILAAEGVTVGQIAPGAIVPVANFGYVKVSDALDALVVAASASGVPHYWMIDANKQIWFVSYAAIVGPAVDGTLIDSGYLSGVVPSVIRANPNYRNWQYAVGGVQQTGTNDETRQGDSQTRSFTYNYPLAQAPTIFTLNGVTKTLGLKGQTGFQYYYAIGDPVIAQDSGQTILVSTDRLRMVYVGQVPAVFQANNASQIAAQAQIDGTSGINEAVLTDNTITTASDGNSKVNAQLSQYSMQGELFQFATLDTSYVPGQLRAITYLPLGFFGTQMLITEVDTSDQQDGNNLWNTISAVIGPYDVTWVEFFSRLFKKNAIAASISLGITLPSHLAPSKTLAPNTTLAPG